MCAASIHCKVLDHGELAGFNGCDWSDQIETLAHLAKASGVTIIIKLIVGLLVHCCNRDEDDDGGGMAMFQGSLKAGGHKLLSDEA